MGALAEEHIHIRICSLGKVCISDVPHKQKIKEDKYAKRMQIHPDIFVTLLLVCNTPRLLTILVCHEVCVGVHQQYKIKPL